MPSPPSFARLCKQVATDVVAGRLEADGVRAVDFLDEHPEAVLDLLDVLASEAQKKRPSEERLSAYVWMLGYGLEFIRYRVERNLEEGHRVAEAVRCKIAGMAADPGFDPGVLMLMLGQFTRARLEIGDELRDLAAAARERASSEASPEDPDAPAGIDDFLAEIAQLVDGNAFLLHQQLYEQAGTLPPSQRAQMALAMLQSREAVVRDTALGWLFDDASDVRTAAICGLEHAAKAGLLGGVALRRMIAARNWLPAGERGPIDSAIKTCRLRGIDCASWPSASIEAVMASAIDGSGAQSLFVLTRERRRKALVSFLVKGGAGVRDTFVEKSLTHADVDSFMFQVTSAMDLFPSSVDHLRLSIRHGLAVNVASGTMPPFGLLEAAEAVGIADLEPQMLEPEALVALLEKDIDRAEIEPAGMRRQLASSEQWPEIFGFAASWFEADGTIEALLAADRTTRSRQAALVLERALPDRRRYWAGIFGWTGLTLREGAAGGQRVPGADWQGFAVAARALLEGADLATIPIMRRIALQTVEVFHEERAARRPSPRGRRRSPNP